MESNRQSATRAPRGLGSIVEQHPAVIAVGGLPGRSEQPGRPGGRARSRPPRAAHLLLAALAIAALALAAVAGAALWAPTARAAITVSASDDELGRISGSLTIPGPGVAYTGGGGE